MNEEASEWVTEPLPPEFCHRCFGHGAWPEPRVTWQGDYYEDYVDCPDCGGTGFDKKYLMDIISEDMV